jgi:type II secretory pathway pseudopilin PulG
MQEKQTAGLFLEIFAMVAILGILSAIAIPHVGQMTGNSRSAARATEYHNIQIAAIEMLYDSAAGTLVPTGPTTDMSQVHTSDKPPLVLADYLSSKSKKVTLGCSYIFAADGTVIQDMP